MTAPAPALLLHHVDVPFGDATGIHDISINVAPGERMVLLAPSGAGKTTLMRAIAGLAPVSAGSIHVAGTDVTAAPPEARGAAYLHQSPMLFPHLTVADNVAFALRLRGMSAADISHRVAQLLDAVHLGALGARHPHTLSGGQQHRVALARALAARPHLLLLDEPLASLDPALRADVRAVMLAVHQHEGAAMVVATHDLDDAAAIGERIALLLDGRLAQVATPADLFRKPASIAVARFLDTANLIAGEMADGAFVSALGRIEVTGRVVSGAVFAVVPIDAIRTANPGDVNTISGVVRDVREQPRHTVLRVQVQEEMLDMIAPRLSLAMGDAISLVVEPSAVHIVQARDRA